jgi:hypothetical protein
MRGVLAAMPTRLTRLAARSPGKNASQPGWLYRSAHMRTWSGVNCRSGRRKLRRQEAPLGNWGSSHVELLRDLSRSDRGTDLHEKPMRLA